MPIPAAHLPEANALPAPLRALLEAELAAGNAIAEVGHTFPAPPAGAYFRLTKPLQSRPRKSGDGIDYYDRNNSSYSGEISDFKRFYFLLEPPRPPETQPEMDAIRDVRSPRNREAGLGEMSRRIVAEPDRSLRRSPSPPAAAAGGTEPPDHTVEVDVRGEMLTYCELTRSAHVICTFGGNPCLVPRTLSHWFYPLGRRSEKMSEEEKEIILQRIADYCRKHHRMHNLVFEA